MKKGVLSCVALMLVLSACGTRQAVRDTDQAIQDALSIPDGVEFVSVAITDVPDVRTIDITGGELTLSVDSVIEKHGQSIDVDLCYVMREGRTSQQMGIGFQRLLGTNEEFSNPGMFSLSCNDKGNVQINQVGLSSIVALARTDPNGPIGQVIGQLIDLDDEEAVEEFVAPRDTKERSTRIWVQHLEGLGGWPIPNVQGERSNEIRVRCPR